MTIICPRCATRFPAVSNSVGPAATPSCPSCGARVQLPREATRRRPSTPDAQAAIGAARWERDGDLPVPKRPVPVSGAVDALMRKESSRAGKPVKADAKAESSDAGVTGLGPAGGGSIDDSQNSLKLRPELLCDLPTPLSPLPRQMAAMPTAPLRTAPAAEIAEPAPAAARIPATRPELPLAARLHPPAIREPSLSREPLLGSPTRPEIAVSAVPPPRGAAPPAAGSEPSDSTAPEPIEAMEQRMHAAAVKPSVKSPTGPARPAHEPGAPPEPVLVTSAAGVVDAAVLALPTSSAPAAEHVPAVSPSGSGGPSSQRAETPALPSPAPSAAVPAAVPPVENSASAPAERALPEGAESASDIAEPPHLPMGWIIGALFALALLLTVWIAHRAGVFGPPAATPPPYDPASTSPPRMP